MLRCSAAISSFIFMPRTTQAAKQSSAEDDLRMIARVLSGGVGEHHLRTLVDALAKALDARMVILGRLSGSGERVETVALYDDGSLRQNMSYLLEHTPCASVLSGDLCLYPSGVAKRFPLDLQLAEIGAEAYAGTPLVDSLGRVLGLLSIIFSHPIRDQERVTTLLRIFSSRASLELERLLIDQRMYRQITADL